MNASSEKGDFIQIHLPDVIDERTDLEASFGKTKSRMHIDCGKVKRINSVGIRTLMLNLTRLKNEGAALVVSGLTPPMVEAMAFISNLLPKGAKVESIFIPYCCTSCQHSFMVLHPLKELKGKAAEVQHTSCEKCGKDAEFDHVPELYFNWIDGLSSE